MTVLLEVLGDLVLRVQKLQSSQGETNHEFRMPARHGGKKEGCYLLEGRLFELLKPGWRHTELTDLAINILLLSQITRAPGEDLVPSL